MDEDLSELTEKEQDKLLAAFEAIGPDPACPWCGSRDWVIGSYVISGKVIQRRGDKQQRHMPLVTLMSPCGYVAFFSAGRLGMDVNNISVTNDGDEGAG